MLVAASWLLSILSVVSAVDIVRHVHFANMNHSLFTDYLYDRTNAICFTDINHPVNAYVEKFTDSDNPYFDVDIGSLTREAVEVNITSSSIYYDIATKSIEQRLENKGLNGQPDEVLFSIKLAKSVAVNATAESYDIDIAFKNADCNKSFTAFVINNVTSFSQQITCTTGVYGSVIAMVNIIQETTYACLYQQNNPIVYPDTSSPSVGLEIDFHYSLITGSVYRAMFPESGHSYPPEGPLNYKDLIRDLQYGVQFEQKPAGINKLRLSQNILNVTISYVHPDCTAISGAKCMQCSPEYQYVNGGCQCSKNGTIDEYRAYDVIVDHHTGVTENSTYFQEKCRVIGQGADEAAANCETQIDYYLRKKYYVAISTSTQDSGILNISLINIDPGLNDIAKTCSSYKPTMSLYLVYHGTHLDAGDHGMGYPIIHDFQPDLTQGRVDKFITLNDLTAKIKNYCKITYLQEVKTVYECEIHARIGPSSHTISQEQLFRLNILNYSSAARRELVDAQVYNLNYTKPFYDSLFKTDPNVKVKVFTYNESDTALETVNYNDRYVLTTFGRFEKNQIVRFVFDIVNLTMTGRYALADYKKTAIISDSIGSLPYVGDKCNSTYQNTSFYQRMIMDCHFDLKNNITYSVDLYLYKRDTDISPGTLVSSHVFMFEVYQNKEKILLAGLSKTATVIVIVVILLLMTAAMCYLAIKAGAADNIDIDNIKDNIKDGMKGGIAKVKDAYKKAKKNVKEKLKSSKNNSRDLKEKLIDEEDENRHNESRIRKAKKKRRQEESDDEDIVPESLKKNDISAIKPLTGLKQSDSQEDIFEDSKKPKKKRNARDSDDDDSPKRNLKGSRIDSKAIIPLAGGGGDDDLKFDSQDDIKKFVDSDDEDNMNKLKAKKKKGMK